MGSKQRFCLRATVTVRRYLEKESMCEPDRASAVTVCDSSECVCPGHKVVYILLHITSRDRDGLAHRVWIQED
jgi:hypothetical protein